MGKSGEYTTQIKGAMRKAREKICGTQPTQELTRETNPKQALYEVCRCMKYVGDEPSCPIHAFRVTRETNPKQDAHEFTLTTAEAINADAREAELASHAAAAIAADRRLKASNPKDIIGSDKIPYHLWPEVASILGALGLLDGALKYGRTNWREAGVKCSIYYDALRRHANAWFEGEDIDPDSGLPHFAHMLACIAILVDADANGKLVDDRQYNPMNGYRRFIDKMTEHVKRIKLVHANKHPKHYTIADNTKDKS
jgi:hypothetical protein